jgi:hypothetical protein
MQTLVTLVTKVTPRMQTLVTLRYGYKVLIKVTKVWRAGVLALLLRLLRFAFRSLTLVTPEDKGVRFAGIMKYLHINQYSFFSIKISVLIFLSVEIRSISQISVPFFSIKISVLIFLSVEIRSISQICVPFFFYKNLCSNFLISGNPFHQSNQCSFFFFL